MCVRLLIIMMMLLIRCDDGYCFVEQIDFGIEMYGQVCVINVQFGV